MLRLAPGPGHGWVGAGVAFKHAPKRIAGTLAVAGGADHAEPWAPLVERSAARVDAARDALRSWDEAGFRQSKTMGWDWQRGQVTDPDAVAWQYLVVAVVTASSRDIFGCSKNRQNRIVENSTYPLDDFGFR